MPVSPTVSEERFAMCHVVHSKKNVSNPRTASAVQAYANVCETDERCRRTRGHIVLVAKNKGGTAILEKAALSAPTCCASLCH